MKKIPYGESNFSEIIENNMYYYDKTKYIEILEEFPKYQFFIRPRRFGKSLFLDTLATYYDVSQKDNFQKYFGNLYIGKNPTEDANAFLVLRLSFASIVCDSGMDRLLESFDHILQVVAAEFLYKYVKFLPSVKLTHSGAVEILQELHSFVKMNNQKMMILIDEYDNFANNLLISDEKTYISIAHTEGRIRTFFKELKEGTATAALSRCFVTGVSPMLLDDLTSGANNFTNISNEKSLNSMIGFTLDEVKEILDYYKVEQFIDVELLIETMSVLYNNYKFNSKVTETVFNTGMTMYLLLHILKDKNYPDNMIDNNVKTDYGKIRMLAEYFQNSDQLRDIAENGQLIGPISIKEQFGINMFKEEMSVKDNSQNECFYSLLYYLGFLTIKEKYSTRVMLGIPNYCVKQMYWDYLIKQYGIENYSNMQEIVIAIDKMRMNGDLQDIMKCYQQIRIEMSNRDLLHYNETTSKAIFMTLLWFDGIYILESEREAKPKGSVMANNGFADLYVKESHPYRQYVKYRFIFEFKHVKDKDNTPENIQKVFNDGIVQINKYVGDKDLLNDSALPLVKAVVLTVSKSDVVWKIVE